MLSTSDICQWMSMIWLLLWLRTQENLDLKRMSENEEGGYCGEKAAKIELDCSSARNSSMRTERLFFLARKGQREGMNMHSIVHDI